jgi:predicted RNA-binding Zn-ribbon protein involved in translation (DUF1610 family)
MASAKKVWRSGVRFDCPECGTLLRDDVAHSPFADESCTKCGGALRLVAFSDSPHMAGDAKWFRCQACAQLHMLRRGELVTTQPRSGFAEFA